MNGDKWRSVENRMKGCSVDHLYNFVQELSNYRNLKPNALDSSRLTWVFGAGAPVAMVTRWAARTHIAGVGGSLGETLNSRKTRPQSARGVTVRIGKNGPTGNTWKTRVRVRVRLH